MQKTCAINTVGNRFHTETLTGRFSVAQIWRDGQIPPVWAYNPKRNHLVGTTVQDDSSSFHGLGRSPMLPRRAKQDESGIAAVDAHGNSPAPGRANNDFGLVFVKRCLGCRHSVFKIIIVKGWVDDFVAVFLQIARLDAARSGVPAVEKKDLHTNSGARVDLS